MLSIFALFNQCNLAIYLISSEQVIQTFVKIGIILSGTSSPWILWMENLMISTGIFKYPLNLGIGWYFTSHSRTRPPKRVEITEWAPLGCIKIYLGSIIMLPTAYSRIWVAILICGPWAWKESELYWNVVIDLGFIKSEQGLLMKTYTSVLKSPFSNTLSSCHEVSEIAHNL